MSAKKRPAAALEDEEPSPHVLQRLQRHLVQCGTAVGVVEALTALQDAGALRLAGFAPRKMKKDLTKAKGSHADVPTSYGRVVQVLELPTATIQLASCADLK